MRRTMPLNLAAIILTGILVTCNCPAAVMLPDAPSGISVQVDTDGSYEIRAGNPSWTFGGNVGYQLQEIKSASGHDAIGAYQEVTFQWTTFAEFSASIRRYDDKPAVLFFVNAPAVVNAKNISFPSFTRVPANLHGFSYGEKNFAPPSFDLEENATPWLLFDDAANTAIISPAANFFVARMSGDGRTGITSGLNPELA